MSIDPLGEKYNWQTNYAFGSNQVVHSREIEGLEAVDDNNRDHPVNFEAELNIEEVFGIENNLEPAGIVPWDSIISADIPSFDGQDNQNENDINTIGDEEVETEDSGIEDFLDNWNDINDINDEIISPVTGIFEAGATRASKGINSAVDIASNARILKVAGNISVAGNFLGVGYALTKFAQNPSASNGARLAAQGAIIGIEFGVNAFFPGLGFVVGFGLSAFESSDYVQGLYN